MSSVKIANYFGPSTKEQILETYAKASSRWCVSMDLSFSKREAGAVSLLSAALSGRTYCFLMIFLLGSIILAINNANHLQLVKSSRPDFIWFPGAMNSSYVPSM